MTLAPEGGVKRVRAQEFDERRGALITQRVRLYPAMDRNKLHNYVVAKYGKIPAEEDGEELPDQSEEKYK